MNNNQSNQSVPSTCTPNRTLNQHPTLQTVYSSKCNDHVTPNPSNTSNFIADIKSDKSWSNVRGFGFIQQATCNNKVTEYAWNRIPTLNVSKNNQCQ
jgi:hypothetical protein